MDTLIIAIVYKIPLIASAFSFLYVIWGLILYISNSRDDAKKQEGKNKMIWGSYPLIFMALLWVAAAILVHIYLRFEEVAFALVYFVAPAICLLFFVWGLIQYVSNSRDDAKKQKGKKKIVYGIYSLIFMVSLFVVAYAFIMGQGDGDFGGGNKEVPEVYLN